MQFFRKPWFVAVACIAAIALHTWLASPVSMLALGLPFYAAMLLVMLLDHAPTTIGSARRVAGPLGKIGGYACAALAVAYLVYVVWGRFTDTGLVGWLDAVQARSDGRYSPKMSFVVALLYPADLGLILLIIQQWLVSHTKTRAPRRTAREVA